MTADGAFPRKENLHVRFPRNFLGKISARKGRFACYASMCRVFHEPIRHPCAHNKGMALDLRLECLRKAIIEGWSELEADEANGMLVIKVKKGAVRLEAEEEARQQG